MTSAGKGRAMDCWQIVKLFDKLSS